jgi:formylmethanofuran dehydrogenase subunit C
MERRGLEKSMLKPGAAVTVEGYANRDKPGEMRAERIIVDGKTIELR